MASRFAAAPAPLPGLYLWGGVGRGKTYCMDYFYANLAITEKRREHFHQFMADIHAALHRLPPQPDPLKVIVDDLASDTRVLCLDEFVVTDIGDAMLLHGLLQALFERAVTLVTTSNTVPDQLYRKGLQRQRFLPAIELIQRHTRVLHLDGGIDYRLGPGAETASLLAETGPAADAWLQRRFDELAGEPVTGAASLRINRRDIPLRRLGQGVVWFDFDVLCNSPRSSVDYLSIAHRYHSVMVSDVPVLTPSLDEAARRFLHLVDVFYDRKVRLILTTAGPLEHLYQGNLPAAAYERLNSRLVEMLAWHSQAEEIAAIP
jgi:cell division protein ZapE